MHRKTNSSSIIDNLIDAGLEDKSKPISSSGTKVDCRPGSHPFVGPRIEWADIDQPRRSDPHETIDARYQATWEVSLLIVLRLVNFLIQCPFRINSYFFWLC